MVKKTRDEKPTVADLNLQLKNLESKVKTASPKFDPKEHKDKTRSRIAFTFTVGYFVLLGGSMLGVPLYNLYVLSLFGERTEMVLQIRDVLLAVSGITSGPIGFVVGYYFKGSENDANA